jgi:hypothetical protein
MKIRFQILWAAAALSVPATGSAQSILLSASSFSLLGGSAITNTGVTIISGGNVGLYPTAESAITGIPPAVITGGTAIATGTVTEQAQTDFAKAAAGLADMPSTLNLSGEDLGNMTLGPGVYTFGAAAELTGTLTLDADFQNNAFWVFQIGSTLTALTGSSVTVINLGSNGGSDDGIFWDAGTAIVIGVGSQVLGNYLAGTSITFDTSVQGSARALAVDAISLDTNIVNAEGGPDNSDWTGGLTYNDIGQVVPVPEPAAYAGILSLGVMGLVLWRRRGKVAVGGKFHVLSFTQFCSFIRGEI